MNHCVWPRRVTGDVEPIGSVRKPNLECPRCGAKQYKKCKRKCTYRVQLRHLR